MRPFKNIIYFSILFYLTSCSNGQNIIINPEQGHPAWQDNYYKYKTNKPDIPESKILRLGFNKEDTAFKVDSLREIEIINANSTSLSHIPDDLYKLNSIKSLNLTWTELKYFPRVVFKMPQLISLDFAFTDNAVVVDTLSYNFLKLKNLELLSLISCRLKDIPKLISELKKLKLLDLSQNQISTLSGDIGNLDSLVELDLSQNRLASLPNEIKNLTLLEKLNLYNNKLTVLPSSFWTLSNLQELNLQYNDFKTLPIEILKLQNIRTLDLSNNPNFHISKKLAIEMDKHLPKLKSFYLNNTNLTQNEMKELSKIFKDKAIFWMKD